MKSFLQLSIQLPKRYLLRLATALTHISPSSTSKLLLGHHRTSAAEACWTLRSVTGSHRLDSGQKAPEFDRFAFEEFGNKIPPASHNLGSSVLVTAVWLTHCPLKHKIARPFRALISSPRVRALSRCTTDDSARSLFELSLLLVIALTRPL